MKIIHKCACPTCKKEVEWSEKCPDRPFCSEKCKLIDIGEWASGAYSIPCKMDFDSMENNL